MSAIGATQQTAHTLHAHWPAERERPARSRGPRRATEAVKSPATRRTLGQGLSRPLSPRAGAGNGAHRSDSRRESAALESASRASRKLRGHRGPLAWFAHRALVPTEPSSGSDEHYFGSAGCSVSAGFSAGLAASPSGFSASGFSLSGFSLSFFSAGLSFFLISVARLKRSLSKLSLEIT